MLEDDDMRAVFFDTDDFAVEATITVGNAAPFTVKGIFDARPMDNPVGLSKAQVGFKDGALNVGNSPLFHCRESDVASVKAGRATAVINGKTFNVWDVKPDGTGMAFLILKVSG